MKHLLSLLIALPLFVAAQQQSTTAWQQILYSESPNAHELREAYETYYKEHDFVKTNHTQAYKRWITLNRKYIQEDGSVVYPTAEERNAREQQIKQKQSASRGADIWSYAGPEVHYDADGSLTPGFRHSNIYCHDRSAVNPDILFCGSESGGAFKSTDGGQTWVHVTEDLIAGDVQSIRIHPTNYNIVLMSTANDLWRTVDGGETWSVIGQVGFVSQNIRASQIDFNLDNPDIIYAACNLGFYRTTDGGDNWTEVLLGQCRTIAIKPDDASVVYTIQEVDEHNSKFFKSIDYGATWTMYDNGWFDNDNDQILPEGGRLATTAADPNRIYALLVGYQEDNSTVITNGWIGTWVSYDAGETWTFPHGLIGTPYDEETHPNLMNFQAEDGDYTQINYNTTMIASQLDADKVLIGGLNLWKSTDACATYEGVGGYIGGISYFHMDQQEYRIYQTSETTEEIWFSNDGGIGFSDDFMETHQNLNRGIQAVNLWGYDQGWNEDMMVGGRYHNGNMAYHELYPAKEFLALGGGEAATGYVNYTDENKTYFSDIGGYIIPDALDGNSVYFATSTYPSESYWNNNSSRMLFDNQYFNVAWLGRENKLYRSTNGGSSFSEFHAFGTNTANQVLWIEQSYADHNYMYLHYVTGSTSHIQHTTDGGVTWSEIDIPLTLREMVFTTSATNPEELWVAYYYGTNGNKVYHTTNAGEDWENITTTALNGEEPWAITHQYGTDGGVYLAMKNGLVFYRNNTMSDWESYSTGLPASTEPLRIVPYYKGEKIRFATWNLGVWEANFFEPSALIADFAAEFGTYFCPGDAVHFVDHSVAGDDATYEWSFPGATPDSSTDKNPTVTYDDEGTYDVTLTVTWNGNSETVTKTSYISSTDVLDFGDQLIEDFETGSFPEWSIDAHPTGGTGSWAINDDVGAFGVSEYCMSFDNYYHDAQGNRDEIWFGKFSPPPFATISFDWAYAPYGGQYTDTLAILVSYDCGDSWEEIFVEGGEELATADATQDYFVPTASEWASEWIAVAENEDFIIAFQNRGHYGNVIYVDNINIHSGVDIQENQLEAAMVVYPNPATDALQISASQLPAGKLQLTLYDALGQVVYTEHISSVGSRLEKRVDVAALAQGLYTLQLKGDGVDEVTKVEVR
ncbi:MAG: VPS10 domain-containing protein [Flavobacteriales bacterium]